MWMIEALQVSRGALGQPSPLMLHLQQEYRPGLFEYEGAGYCKSVAVNFAGSLAVHYWQDQILNAFEFCGKKPRESVTQPVYLLHNVPLVRYRNKLGNWMWVYGLNGEKLTAPTVLVKQACGNPAGLVIEGELSGLVLGHLPTIRALENTNSWAIGRVLNEQVVYFPERDEEIYRHVLPYVVDGGEEIVKTPEYHDFENQFRLLCERYGIASKMIFDLVKQIFGIVIDQNTFHLNDKGCKNFKNVPTNMILSRWDEIMPE